MKDYGHLFRDDPLGERAAASPPRSATSRAAGRARAPARAHPVDLRVAYHDACHLAHAQGVRAQPRDAAADDPRPRAASSPPSGRSAAARPASTTCSARARGRARPPQGRATCSPPAPRPSPPPTPAARCRSGAHAAGHRCRSITRWSCSTASIHGRQSHDHRRPRPCHDAADESSPTRRSPSSPTLHGASSRAGASCSSRARERQARARRGRDARLPARDARRSATATGRWRRRPPTCRTAASRSPGPADRKMVINALNSGARGFMADFEDSLSPTWTNMIQGQVNLHRRDRGHDRVHRRDGSDYKLDDDVATLLVRPRGWHLRREARARRRRAGRRRASSTPGSTCSATPSGCSRRARARTSTCPRWSRTSRRGCGTTSSPSSRSELGLDRGTVKATVLIETLPAGVRDGGDPLRAARRTPLG